ncbi:MAG: right-handed parallel beta-helix repeat-containing protein, partial [Bacteroidia bacterium]|nr:right-handed parallel beta-helix repeat-containing protein [Bacteroidia bacterium]
MENYYNKPMKKLLVVIFLFFSLVTSATNYYVSNSGSDSNSGKSSSRPWLTLSKVNDHKFSPGDIIHFKRGDTFRGFLYIDSDINGTSGNPITFDAYGTGAKPKLWGSKDYSSSTQWTLSSGNIWVTTNAVTTYTDISNLIFNNEAAYGAKKSTLAGCTTQGDWFLNTSDKKVYLFSASNPGSYYLHIEVGGAYVNAGGYSVEEVIKLNSADYITIRNLDVRYSPNNGIAFMYGCTYCVVEYCDISWVGGMYVSGSTTTRMGNGLHIWVAADNIIWRYNIINQCFDAGVSPQGSGTYTQSNIDIYCNIITNCYYSYEIFTRTNNTITNVNFYNNTCINAGSQWSQFQRGGGGSDEHLRNSQTGATFSGYRIKNNIFYGSVTRAIQT